MIGTGLGLAIGAIAGAGGSIASGIMGSKAAGKAAGVQSAAADRSADLQLQGLRETNQLTRDMFDRQQASLKPWLETGGEAAYQLRDLLKPGGELAQGFDEKFDSSKVQFDPGFDYRMEQSQKAIERWAASKGTLLSGGTGMKLIRNAQDMTSNEYGRAYDRALGEWGNARDTFYQNQDRRFGRLSSLAGLGQTATGQLNAADAGATGSIVDSTLNTARGVGATGEAGAAANAAGTVGGANAWINALQNLVGNFQGAMTLNSFRPERLSAQLFTPNYARG